MKLANLFILLFFILSVHGSTSTPKHYIVYMGAHSYADSETVISSNHEMLASVVGSVHEARQATIHHYSKSFRGFSAMLTPEQADQISKSNSVVSIFESKLHHLHTTRSWDFIGEKINELAIDCSVPKKYNVIVGHIDSGVWPESKSFSPDGLWPVPNKFRGECVTGDQFTSANCNRKIIGARYYYGGYEADKGPLENMGVTFYRSARDDFGHGSHTASIALGSVVKNLTIEGMGTHTARGGATGARIAVYKVCWFNYCSCADILKAYDDAIHDNVDIITISAGQSPSASNYFEDCFSIGAFHAFWKGILVSSSAGNVKGPATVTNAAPWILTVAASSIDREFMSVVHLGNKKSLKGYGLNHLQLKGNHPVIAASAAAAPGVPIEEASFCKQDALNNELIRGKIVVCTMETMDDDKVLKSMVVREGGGVGMIVIDPNYSKEINENFSVRTSIIGQEEGQELQAYLHRVDKPIASISQTQTFLNTKPAPKMASFSSRGPNRITPDIIKPDITAPGLNILAAWPPTSTDDKVDALSYHIDSGTSMSCPHATGVAALIKAVHKDWSPAAIRSAMMTTATVLDNTGSPIQSGATLATPFDFGSGHLSDDALDPGLVYDFDINDIVAFLCSNGASPVQLGRLMEEPVQCGYPPVPSYNLNYPSIGISNVQGPGSVYRTVTFKGKKGDPTVYRVSIEYPDGVKLRVVPDTLDFSDGQTKAMFRVDLLTYKLAVGWVFGSITWSDGVHRVRSPIAVNLV